MNLVVEDLRRLVSSRTCLFERVGGLIRDPTVLGEIDANRAEFETCLDALAHTNQRLTTVLDDLLLFHRTTQSTELDMCSAVLAVDVLVAEINALLARGSVEYEVTNHSSRRTIIADMQWVMQAVTKLVSNALACARGKVCVDVDVESDTANETSVLCIVVKDDGPTIPPSIAKAMFDPFKSISHHSSEKMSYPGGLELPTALNICRAHNGGCSFERQVGRNCFRATFTLGTEESRPITNPHGLTGLTVLARGSSKQPTTCVLVDDSALARKMMARRMGDLGVSVTNQFENGIGVAQYCTAHPPSFVVLDREMPEQGGLETAVELREAKYTGPIIAVTGSVTDKEVEEFTACGASVVLPKPTSAVDIVNAFAAASHH